MTLTWLPGSPDFYCTNPECDWTGPGSELVCHEICCPKCGALVKMESENERIV